MKQRITAITKSLAILVFLVVFVFSGSMTYALSDAQKRLFQSNIHYFDADSCGGNSQPGASSAPGSGPIYIMGDSITALSKTTYQAKFSGGGWTPTIEGLGSRHTVGTPPSPDGLGQIKQAADKTAIGNAKAIVVALGTNDSGGSASSIKKDVTKLMDQLKSEDTGSAPIYWVNILDTRSDANSKKTNQAISDATGADAAIIDWYSEAKGKADLASFEGGVHPTKQKDIDLLVDLVYGTVSGTVGGATPVAEGDCACSTSSTTLSGKDNPEKVWNFFKGKGLSDEQVAGIMGNMQQESSFNPELIEGGGVSKDPRDSGGGGWGIIQWTPGSKIIDEAKTAGITGPIYELASQLDLVWQHMHNNPVVTKPFDLGHFKTINDEVSAAVYFGSQIEGFGTEGARLQYATDILKQFGGGSGGTGSATDNGGGCPASNASSPDCATATGNAKILCEAKKYDPVDYTMGGGHAGGTAYHKACPDIKSNNSGCALDCSGLVSVAVFDAFGGDGKLSWDTNSLRADSANWKKISFADIKPGDVLEPNSDHVEIIDHVTGSKITTFGAHSPNPPQPEQVGPSSYTNASSINYYHYTGKGSL